MLKKIIEEAGETALAGKGGLPKKMTEELADLFFHCLVAMNRYNIALKMWRWRWHPDRAYPDYRKKPNAILIKRENGRNKWAHLAFGIG